MDIEQLKFPIGKFKMTDHLTPDQLEDWIRVIEEFPIKLEQILSDAPHNCLNWKYRPNGWTVNQVIHHCADSHMNSFIRFKLALTEDTPVIKPYFEDKWALLPDAEGTIFDSMLILKGVHRRWTILLRNLSVEQLDLTFIHPQYNKSFSLKENIGIYSWHCRHHFAHVEIGIKSSGKYDLVAG